MKRVFTSLAVLFLLFGLTACSSESSTGSEETEKKSPEKETTENDKLLSKEEFEKMYSDPKKYKGSKVEFYAKIFLEPEKDDEGTYLQVYAENNDERNTIVAIEDPKLNVKVDDIIKVTGVVYDEYEGENLMGGTLVLPMVKADSIEVVDYVTAFSPAIKTIEVNKEINQHGLIVKLSKIEIAENETRLYVTVNNTTEEAASFYDFNTKLIIGSQQLEATDNYDANYPELQSELLSGIQTEGIISFDKIPESGSLKVYSEGSTDNYELDFEPYQFDVTY